MTVDPVERRVLAVGIPVLPPKPEALQAQLDPLHPLQKAPGHALAVSRALTRFGYQPCSGGNRAKEDPGGAIRTAVTSGEGVLVVHVVAHGKRSPAGERGVHVVGTDGACLDDPISAWISLIESHPEKPRPHTLFLLDLCYSGAAASLAWHQEMAAEQRRAWVIAACGPDDRAFDFRLSRAAVAVFNGFHDGSLPLVDTSVPYIPLERVAGEIRRFVAELNTQEGLFQNVEGSRISLTDVDDLGELPFFPNPRYQTPTSALTEVAPEIASLLDEVFDPRHFLYRAAGTEALGRGVGQGYFRGRRSEVATLAGWFNGDGPPLQVVTGKPGVGKSALLGVLICAAHPALRHHTQQLWMQLADRPASNDRLAVVHARHRSLEEISDSLARQMGADSMDRPETGWAAEHLVRLATDAPGAAGTPFTVVIDALDEAERPQDVARALLIPLAEAARRGQELRLLVATRADQRVTPLLDAARDARTDLDQTDREEVERALYSYVQDLLADTEYGHLDAIRAGEALARAIAARLTTDQPLQPDQGQPRTAPLGWGEFLVAGLYLRHVLDQGVERDPEKAARLGHAVPLTLPDLLGLDLARRTDQPWFRPTLAALAHADGAGMPERVIAHIAAGFALPARPGGTPGPLKAVRDALNQARFYLRSDVDHDGTTLYRLFHEGLAERLRTDPYCGYVTPQVEAR
ncbi:AAA family ATPase [Streptacidiphilus sp. N1-3]|uniref:AAA family ATPase n=1 Tax=Streptacidiphilus alkalitolerans TaxID=3342712 RepID=A0ABV6XD34_9ACTN